MLEILDGDGSVGAQLAGADVDVVAHVGSSATGRAIALACARTGAKAVLENGGNDPLIVDEGVDPAWAAEQAALGAFANAGQICVSVERIYCHAALADPFLAALTAEARAWQDRLGPLVDRRHRDHVHGHVAEALAAGARALTGGEVPDGQGAYYPPTVLIGCTPQMRVMREETFGPVAPVRVVPDFDTALLEAVHDDYGLAATVLTSDMAHAQAAWRALPVGTVKVNNVFGGAPGGAAAAAPGERVGLRVRPRAARRDDHDQGGAPRPAGRRLSGAAPRPDRRRRHDRQRPSSDDVAVVVLAPQLSRRRHVRGGRAGRRTGAARRRPRDVRASVDRPGCGTRPGRPTGRRST